MQKILGRGLGHTAWLMLSVMLVMVPTSLLLGVLSGMREGSRLDRVLSTIAIASTATPEYVSGVILVALFASATAGLSPILADLGWISGKTLFMGTATSALDSGITFWNFGLPVMTIALYAIGYIARMTRASMTEVMTAQYIRTARLKGVSFRQVVMRHALRNALIALQPMDTSSILKTKGDMRARLLGTKLLPPTVLQHTVVYIPTLHFGIFCAISLLLVTITVLGFSIYGFCLIGKKNDKKRNASG